MVTVATLLTESVVSDDSSSGLTRLTGLAMMLAAAALLLAAHAAVENLTVYRITPQNYTDQGCTNMVRAARHQRAANHMADHIPRRHTFHTARSHSVASPLPGHRRCCRRRVLRPVRDGNPAALRRRAHAEDGHLLERPDPEQ
jgi:hypothetical protein